jgi:cbb3-type cytochrome oxidase maturation protein
MSVIFLLLAASLVVATAFLVFFVWAVKTGQFDDTTTPAMRMLLDDTRNPTLDTKQLRTEEKGQGRPTHDQH